MESKDLYLSPIYLLIIYGLAYWIRPRVTNKFTKKYFIPALTVKLSGAVALGLIYQFYYEGGDTYNYFNSSKIVYNAFNDSFNAGFKLLIGVDKFDPDIHRYSSQIRWYTSSTEYFVVRVATILSLISFNTYTVIALFFAFISFSGIWAMFITFLKMYPGLHKQFAISIFFLPSVFFWGSGLMKDSLTIGALGWLFYGFYRVFMEHEKVLKGLMIIFVAAYIIYAVKVYILLSFLPPALFWIFLENNNKIKNAAIRYLAKPLFIILGLVVSYIGATTLTEGDERYDLEKIGERTKINSDYLGKYQASGSAYDIGVIDGSFASMISVGPQAIVVALYRPFLWEVKSPIMLLSALEATLFIFLTIRFTLRTGLFRTFHLISSKPILIFCIIFSLVFAFGIGTNSGNFGTLVRYKIPFMPFYLSALYIMQSYSKRPKKLRRLAVTA